MTDINKDFSEFIAILNQHHVEYVIVGSFALAFLGFPRATGDIDIWVRPNVSNVQALLRAMKDFGFESLDVTQDDILSGKIIQMGIAPVRIDILTQLDGVAADEIWNNRQQGPFGGQTVFYLGKDSFIKNKRAAGRKKDIVDLDLFDESPDLPKTPDSDPS